jgi:predicted dehydrogenase
MRRPIGVGLIGCGHVARLRHLDAVKRLPGTRLVAVADLDRERREAAAARYEVPGSYASAEQLVADPEVEVVGVLVPAREHADVAVAALEAGKHTMVEKPLALDLASCDRMIDAARTSGAIAAVGFNLRAHRLVRRARRLLDRGLIGSVEAIRSVTSGVQERGQHRLGEVGGAAGGGTLLEKGTHHFDLWCHLGGSSVAEVSAIARGASGREDASTLSARLENGALVAATFVEAPVTLNEISLQGPGGRLDVSIYEFDGLRFTPSTSHPGDPGLRLRQVGRALRELPGGLRALRRGGEYAGTYAAEWRRFLDAVRSVGPPDASLEDGRRATQVALAALQSAAEGRSIAIRDGASTLDAALGASRT